VAKRFTRRLKVALSELVAGAGKRLEPGEDVNDEHEALVKLGFAEVKELGYGFAEVKATAQGLETTLRQRS
jgi:hypothetical protein